MHGIFRVIKKMSQILHSYDFIVFCLKIIPHECRGHVTLTLTLSFNFCGTHTYTYPLLAYKIL